MSSNASSSVWRPPAGSVPAAPAARRRSVVEALVTPGRHAPQRARSRIGISPPGLRSSGRGARRRAPPRARAETPVGGRCESANRASMRSSAGSWRPAGTCRPPACPVCTPHTGRLSTTTEAEDQRLLLGRIVDPAPRHVAARTPASARTARSAALTPCSSDAQPAALAAPPIDLPGELEQPPASAPRSSALAEPDDRAVDVGARQRLAARLAAERQPGELDVRARPALHLELEQPPGERVDARPRRRPSRSRRRPGHRAARSPSGRSSRDDRHQLGRRCGRSAIRWRR